MRKALDRVVGHALLLRQDGHRAGRCHGQREVIRRGASQHLRAQSAGAAAALLHREGLPEARLQVLRDLPRADIRAATRRKRQDHAHRPLGPRVSDAMLALTLVFITQIIRVAESTTTAVRNLDYVDAARATGAGTLAILRAHVLPNVLGPIFVSATA